MDFLYIDSNKKQTQLLFLSLFEILDKCWAISIQNENKFERGKMANIDDTKDDSDSQI